MNSMQFLKKTKQDLETKIAQLETSKAATIEGIDNEIKIHKQYLKEINTHFKQFDTPKPKAKPKVEDPKPDKPIKKRTAPKKEQPELEIKVKETNPAEQAAELVTEGWDK